MRCIIAGSRTYHGQSVDIIRRAVEASGFRSEITEVVCGEAKGIDFLGKVWAKGQGIPVKSFPADWEKLGKKAGIVRNLEMAIYAAEIDLSDGIGNIDQDPHRGVGMLLAIHDGKSSGTKHMIKSARALGLRVFVGHPKETAVIA